MSGSRADLLRLLLITLLLAVVVWSAVGKLAFDFGSSDYAAGLSCRQMGYERGEFGANFLACKNEGGQMRICLYWLCQDMGLRQ